MTIPVALLLLGVPTEHVGFIAAGHTPLTITSDSTPDVNTGDTAVVTVTASGSFGDIDFAIIGGADAGLFTINDETGALAFRAASVDGTYEVIVRAFSDWGSAIQTITATVAAASYHADAVHFDGNAFLSIASLIAGADTGFFSGSKWIKTSVFNGVGFWAVDPADTYTSAEQTSSFPNNCWLATFADAAFANRLAVNQDHPVTLFPSDTWVNILVSASTNLSTGNKILQIYLNDTPMTFTKGDDSAAFLMTFTGLPLFVGADTFDNFEGDAADVWLGVGQLIDFSVEANRRKFISASGKPVDLGADGSTPTGTAPTVFFTGNAAAFVTNQGTGGAFTLTGSLTNASTSPSD